MELERNRRTDLASEAHRLFQENGAGRLKGVSAAEERLHGLNVTAVEVLNEEGASALGKSVGKYFTLELSSHFERGSENFPAAAKAVAELIRRCSPLEGVSRVLIAALGNPDITPDAVGPMAAANVLVTRHLKMSAPEEFRGFRATVLCRTGVLGTTGVESAVQVETLCRELRPELVIAVDALAGADASRLCRTVQICSTGIAPGSGVGNDRKALNQTSLGVPVIAVGVPTVIDASHFSSDTRLTSMFVTPRDIDSAVRCAGRLIGYGINLALHDGLTVADIDMLIG